MTQKPTLDLGTRYDCFPPLRENVKIPPSCTVFEASLHATANQPAEADETRLDTQRLQAALDACGAGKAVELQPDGQNDAFLSGPLELREGVTLLVDAGVTLYALRNPADFDTVPGGCGVTGPESHACRPLINIANVSNAAVMGDGALDGRGDRGVIGKPYTWWQQSRAAEPTNARYSAAADRGQTRGWTDSVSHPVTQPAELPRRRGQHQRLYRGLEDIGA